MQNICFCFSYFCGDYFLHLSDERIPLVLWGNVACDLNNAIQVRMEYTSICVLRFGKITVWNGTNIKNCCFVA